MTVKYEEITIEGTVIYCDGDECRSSKGPQAAYDNAEEVIKLAEGSGWIIRDYGDFCPKCAGAHVS